jgi:hypothetical protein
MLFMVSCIGTDIIEPALINSRLEILDFATELTVGDSYQFDAIFVNSMGEAETAPLVWLSLDPEVIAIDETGLASALKAGKTTVVVSFGQYSDSVMVNAGSTTVGSGSERSGALAGKGSYTVGGTAVLSREAGNSLKLQLNQDFQVSNGPGLYLYLSNSGTSVSGGVELGALKATSGSQNYDVPENVTLNTYDFVVVYCKPFRISFGCARLNQ